MRKIFVVLMFVFMFGLVSAHHEEMGFDLIEHASGSAQQSLGVYGWIFLFLLVVFIAIFVFWLRKRIEPKSILAR